MNELSHDEAWHLLPWLANDTLEGGELEGLLEHLKTCSRCRYELRFLPELRSVADRGQSRLPAPGPAWSRLEDRLRRHEGRGGLVLDDLRHRFSSAASRLRWAPRGAPAPWALPAVAALLTILVLALVVAPALRPGRVQEPPEMNLETALFRTLAEVPQEELEGDRPALQVRLIVQPETPELRLREIITALRGTIVDGPSEQGVYTVAVGEELRRDLDTRLEKLRAAAEVIFVEQRFAPQRGRS